MGRHNERLLSQIEALRKQLNENVDTASNNPINCENTYVLSMKLDKLIFQYMKVTRKTSSKN